MENTAVTTFKQRINASGNMEFRCNFGRSKAMVLRRYNGYFYIELYDNRSGKSDKISLGLDEVDFLLNTRDTLDQLKGYFPQMSTITTQQYDQQDTASQIPMHTTTPSQATVGTEANTVPMPMFSVNIATESSEATTQMGPPPVYTASDIQATRNEANTPVRPTMGYTHVRTPFKRANSDDVRGRGGKKLRFAPLPIPQYEAITPPPSEGQECENIPPEMFLPFDY